MCAARAIVATERTLANENEGPTPAASACSSPLRRQHSFLTAEALKPTVPPKAGASTLQWMSQLGREGPPDSRDTRVSWLDLSESSRG